MYTDPETIVYDPTDPIGCSADIYTPTTTEPRDLVIFIHGGAWRTYVLPFPFFYRTDPG